MASPQRNAEDSQNLFGPSPAYPQANSEGFPFVGLYDELLGEIFARAPLVAANLFRFASKRYARIVPRSLWRNNYSMVVDCGRYGEKTLFQFLSQEFPFSKSPKLHNQVLIAAAEGKNIEFFQWYLVEQAQFQQDEAGELATALGLSHNEAFFRSLWDSSRGAAGMADMRQFYMEGLYQSSATELDLVAFEESVVYCTNGKNPRVFAPRAAFCSRRLDRVNYVMTKMSKPFQINWYIPIQGRLEEYDIPARFRLSPELFALLPNRADLYGHSGIGYFRFIENAIMDQDLPFLKILLADPPGTQLSELRHGDINSEFPRNSPDILTEMLDLIASHASPVIQRIGFDLIFKEAELFSDDTTYLDLLLKRGGVDPSIGRFASEWSCPRGPELYYWLQHHFGSAPRTPYIFDAAIRLRDTARFRRALQLREFGVESDFWPHLTRDPIGACTFVLQGDIGLSVAKKGEIIAALKKGIKVPEPSVLRNSSKLRAPPGLL